jgi:fumarate hydratase subunit alpha
LPLCQDTGTAVVFIELGQDVRIEDGLLTDAINTGVAKGYEEGYLRKSMVDPISRINTNDNTPAVIQIRPVAGDTMKITLAPKGGGAENMSALTMLSPSAGLDGIKRFVIDTVHNAGANPCPPVIVGVGIGGNFEEVTLLAKTALLRPIGHLAILPDIVALEAELLTEINNLGIGAQGFGGFSTALAVHIETAPCHFASLPVAVNLNCHVARHKSVIL